MLRTSWCNSDFSAATPAEANIAKKVKKKKIKRKRRFNTSVGSLVNKSSGYNSVGYGSGDYDENEM